MTVQATHAPQVDTYAIPRRVSFTRLIGMIEAVTGWYERKMAERALASLSMSELKDIGYPTADNLRPLSPRT